MSNPIRRAIVTRAARRVIGQALPLVLAGALAACRTTVPQGGDSAAAVDPTQARYRAELAGDARLYRLDPATSAVTIYVFRGGAAAKYGHNHVLAVPQLEGQVRVGESLREAAFSLHFRLDQLQIDDPALRERTGGNFAGERSAADIDGTRRNMLKGLDAGRYPDVVINSLAIAGDWPVAVARIAITLHGVTREQTVPLTLQRDGQQLRIAGGFALRQTDFGATPFSILGGALSVQDEIAVSFVLRAVATD